jgi:hypothetical protein
MGSIAQNIGDFIAFQRVAVGEHNEWFSRTDRVYVSAKAIRIPQYGRRLLLLHRVS